MQSEGRITTAVVLGSSYSGSGAVFDYLAGRYDVFVPRDGRETHVVQNPDGLLAFHSTVYSGFYPTSASVALDRLEHGLVRAGFAKQGWPSGYGLDELVPNYRDKVARYIRALTAAEYSFVNRYFSLHASRRERMRRRVSAMLRPSHHTDRTVTRQRAPVREEEFLRLTRTFLADVYLGETTLPPTVGVVVVNQAGSYWRPGASAKLFESGRAVTVSRDPRDQFVSLRERKGLDDVREFARWYRAMMEIRRMDNGSTVHHVQFERFVMEHKSECVKLCAFLGLDDVAVSEYVAEESIRNVGKYAQQLAPSDIRYIEESLPEWITEY